MALSIVLLCGLVAAWPRAGSQQLQDLPTVQIQQGDLRGTFNYTADGTKYYKFLGIPYAKPPLGNLRFVAPEDPESWSEVRDATNFGPVCNQVSAQESGSEDCLFVNVFTPQLPANGSTSLLPVMVYIHGGAFLRGSGNFDPGHLLDYGLVVASLNYRLGVLGFLSLNGTDAPGNAGLKDQSAALRWIQKNIAQFGGDPKQVTIFGESAGGTSIHYHVLSPLSNGLFHRAISESGSSLDPWAFAKNAEARTFQLGEVLGNKTSNASELLRILRETSPEKLMSVSNEVLTADEKARLILSAFVPSLEFRRSEEKPFLPHEPAYIVKNGLFNKVPYITGVTKKESSTFIFNNMTSEGFNWQDINNNLEQVVPVDLGLAKGSEKSLEVARKVKNFYFGDKMISNETLDQWIDLYSDFLFVLGTVETTHLQVLHSSSSIYNYQFVWGDAHHAMELKFVTYSGKVQGEHSDEARLARLLGGLWTSFAKAGVPRIEGEVNWEPARHGSFPYLQISPSPSLQYDIEKDRMDFWFDIYRNYSNNRN